MALQHTPYWLILAGIWFAYSYRKRIKIFFKIILMNVLSLFWGIECGRVAIDRLWIPVEKYFSSEIDPYAIKITKANYPDIAHIWWVQKVSYHNKMLFGWEDAPEIPFFKWNIDLLIGGSPCQDLSVAKKWWKWLEWEKSWLFYEYVRILQEVKPKWFLLENVASMKQVDRDKITEVLREVYPDTKVHMINSCLVSAQNRKRLYWTNIPWVTQPEDQGIILRDILEDIPMDDQKWKPLDHKYIEKLKKYDWGMTEMNSVGKIRQWYEYFSIDSKMSSLTVAHARNRMIYIWNVHPSGKGMNGNVHHINWKSPTLTTNKWEWPKVSDGYYYRKLTPIECERLQTLPDGYTAHVSDSRRYKAIWNGWTVDIIAHILSHIK